jgi:uncharacterized protein (TIGR03435 family)
MNRNLILTALVLLPVLLQAQPASKLPEFEVADIRPSDPSIMKMGKGRMLPGGRIEVPGYTLRELIMFTYGVTDDMISGGPKWVAEDRFNIVAKAPDGAPDSALRSMMKALLGDRFRLVEHQEDKPMPAYVLTLEKNAAPLAQTAAGGASQCHWTELEGGLRRRECRNVSMDEFAKDLQQTGGIGIFLPVADQTGLKGSYDFQFDVGTSRRSGADSPGMPPDPLDTDGPNIFAALSKIGLKLESRKVPMPVIVIDSAAKPAGN